MKLARFDAPGIYSALIKFLTDPSTRPLALKHCGFTEAHLAKILEAYLGDGASVNGLTTTGPIETPREGENVFWKLGEWRKQHCPVLLLGVRCSPHRLDLIADAITDRSVELPTFASFKRLPDGVSSELKHSGLSKLDLECLNLLLDEEPLKVSPLTYSGKEWLSNVDALTEIVERGFCHVWLHTKQRIPTSSGKTLEKLHWQLQFLESSSTHLITPAYLDMQAKLDQSDLAER